MQQNPDALKRQFERDLFALFPLVFTHSEPVTEAGIRLASVVLRKWLVEGLLGQLCHMIGVTAEVPVIDPSRVIAELQALDPDLEYFLTGGTMFNGTPLQAFVRGKVPPPADWQPELPDRLVGLGAFLEQPRIVYRGTPIRCREIIAFVANKLGGAHLSPTRNERQTALEEASNFMTFGGPLHLIGEDPPGDIYLMLEPKGRELLSGFHIEIIAAATSILHIRLDGQPMLQFEVGTKN